MITQVVVGNTLYPLIEGQPVQFTAGDTLKILYSFKYKMPEQMAGVRVWASCYRYTLGILNRASDAQTKGTIILEKAEDWTVFSGEIDIIIPQKAGIITGLWGLIVELPDYEDVDGNAVEEHIDNCLEATTPPGIFDMIVPLLGLGLMMFITKSTGEEGGMLG